MPDQPSQSLIDALLGHFRAKGQAMADKPMWGETQGWPYPGFPQKGSNAADGALGALLGLGGIASRGGAMMLSRPGPPGFSAGLPSAETLRSLYGDNMHTPGDLNAAFSGAPPRPPANDALAPPIRGQLLQTRDALEAMLAAQRAPKNGARVGGPFDSAMGIASREGMNSPAQRALDPFFVRRFPTNEAANTNGVYRPNLTIVPRDPAKE